MAATVQKNLLGSINTILNTAATLANNSLALSATYNNTIGGTGDGYTRVRFSLSVTFGVAPIANTGCSIWILTTQDGTAGGTFEDGGASLTPARNPDCFIPVRAVNTAQEIHEVCDFPPGNVQVLLKNDNTGQTMNANWTLKLIPYTPEMV